MFNSNELQLVRKAVSHYLTHGCPFRGEEYETGRQVIHKLYKQPETLDNGQKISN